MAKCFSKHLHGSLVKKEFHRLNVKRYARRALKLVEREKEREREGEARLLEGRITTDAQWLGKLFAFIMRFTLAKGVHSRRMPMGNDA